MAGVVRLDKVKSVYHGNIFSVVHNAQLDNGSVVNVGALKSGERELYQVAVPTAGAGALALIAAPEVVVDEQFISNQALENFTTPANKPVRAYELAKGDIFSVSYDMLTALAGGVPVKNNLVVAQAGLKLKEVASVTTEAFVGKIIDLEQIGVSTVVGQAGVVQRITKFAVIEVVKN
jgi:hypothetical protein